MSQNNKNSDVKDTKDPRQIEARLDETKAAISEDIKALGSKLSSENLKQEAKLVMTDVKDGAKEVLVSAKDSAKAAVVDAAVTAKDTVVDAAVTAKDTVVDAAVTAKDTVVDAASSAKATLNEAKDVAAVKLEEYKEAAVETLDEVSETARRVGNVSWDFAKQNAVPLALIGLGGAWLIANGKTRTSVTRRLPSPRSRTSYDYPVRGRIATYTDTPVGAREYDYDYTYGAQLTAQRDREASARARPTARAAVGDGHPVDRAADKARSAVGEVSDRAQELYDKAGETVSEVTHEVTDRAQDLVGRAGTALKRGTAQGRELALSGFARVRDGSRALAQENPLALGAAALAVGIGIGLMLPATNKENALLGPTKDRWVGEAREAAQGVRAAAHTLGETARETTESLI